MKKIMILASISILLVANNVISAWSIQDKEWVYVVSRDGKQEACKQFSGGVCHEKEDVTGRVFKSKTSNGFIYVIKGK